VTAATGFVVPFDEQRSAEATAELLPDWHLRHRMARAAQQRASDLDPALAGDAMIAAYHTTMRTATGVHPATQMAP